MTKKELVEHVESKFGLPELMVERMVDEILKTIVTTVTAGGQVHIHGFGRFYLRQRKEIPGGRGVCNQPIPARKGMVWRAAPELFTIGE